MLIIGLTGPNASGKGLACETLANILDCQLFSLSDELRHELKKNNLEASRQNLIDMGQSMRKEFGNNVLAQRCVHRINESKQSSAFIVDSFRHPSEVDLFKNSFTKFKLLCIESSHDIRFERALLRGRNENSSNLNAFKANEAQENSTKPNSQQLQKTMNMADCKIVNSSSKEVFIKNITAYLNDLLLEAECK